MGAVGVGGDLRAVPGVGPLPPRASAISVVSAPVSPTKVTLRRALAVAPGDVLVAAPADQQRRGRSP